MKGKVFKVNLWMPTAEELAAHIKDVLVTRGRFKESDLCRGVAADIRKYKEMLRYGTDRTREGWQEAKSLLKNEREAQRFGQAQHAQYLTDPTYTWALPLNRLEEACNYACKSTGEDTFPVVLIYDGQALEEEYLNLGYHRFKGDPKKALKGVFSLKSGSEIHKENKYPQKQQVLKR